MVSCPQHETRSNGKLRKEAGASGQDTAVGRTGLQARLLELASIQADDVTPWAESGHVSVSENVKRNTSATSLPKASM